MVSVCDDASVVAAFTLNVTSVLWIICRASTTFGQHSSSTSSGVVGREIFGEEDGEDNGEVLNGLLLVDVVVEGGGSSSSLGGGVVVLSRIGEVDSGVERNGQLLRLVVRSGLKPVICVGLFGEDFGEIFGELAINRCLQLSSFSGAKLNCVGLLNCLNFALIGRTSGSTNCSCCCGLPSPLLSQCLFLLLPPLFIEARL